MLIISFMKPSLSNQVFTSMDLTQQAPRSPRVMLGGYAILPRMLDKGRAQLNGSNGSYHYNCPLDQRLLSFLGIESEELLAELKAGKGDHEILTWITEHAINKYSDQEIASWSTWQIGRAPTSVEAREYFQEMQKESAPDREDIGGWFDLLDVDDFVSFGGKA